MPKAKKKVKIVYMQPLVPPKVGRQTGAAVRKIRTDEAVQAVTRALWAWHFRDAG